MLALKIDLKTPEIENRLIEFAVTTLKIARELRKASNHKSLSRRLIRSSASAALNYGDLPLGGTSLDHILTMNKVLKEVRETCAFLGIILKGNFVTSNRVEFAYQEGKQLMVMLMRGLDDMHR